MAGVVGASLCSFLSNANAQADGGLDEAKFIKAPATAPVEPQNLPQAPDPSLGESLNEMMALQRMVIAASPDQVSSHWSVVPATVKTMAALAQEPADSEIVKTALPKLQELVSAHIQKCAKLDGANDFYAIRNGFDSAIELIAGMGKLPGADKLAWTQNEQLLKPLLDRIADSDLNIDYRQRTFRLLSSLAELQRSQEIPAQLIRSFAASRDSEVAKTWMPALCESMAVIAKTRGEHGAGGDVAAEKEGVQAKIESLFCPRVANEMLGPERQAIQVLQEGRVRSASSEVGIGLLGEKPLRDWQQSYREELQRAIRDPAAVPADKLEMLLQDFGRGLKAFSPAGEKPIGSLQRSIFADLSEFVRSSLVASNEARARGDMMTAVRSAAISAALLRMYPDDKDVLGDLVAAVPFRAELKAIETRIQQAPPAGNVNTGQPDLAASMLCLLARHAKLSSGIGQSDFAQALPQALKVFSERIAVAKTDERAELVRATQAVQFISIPILTNESQLGPYSDLLESHRKTMTPLETISFEELSAGLSLIYNSSWLCSPDFSSPAQRQFCGTLYPDYILALVGKGAQLENQGERERFRDELVKTLLDVFDSSHTPGDEVGQKLFRECLESGTFFGSREVLDTLIGQRFQDTHENLRMSILKDNEKIIGNILKRDFASETVALAKERLRNLAVNRVSGALEGFLTKIPSLSEAYAQAVAEALPAATEDGRALLYASLQRYPLSETGLRLLKDGLRHERSSGVVYHGLSPLFSSYLLQAYFHSPPEYQNFLSVKLAGVVEIEFKPLPAIPTHPHYGNDRREHELKEEFKPLLAEMLNLGGETIRAALGNEPTADVLGVRLALHTEFDNNGAPIPQGKESAEVLRNLRIVAGDFVIALPVIDTASDRGGYVDALAAMELKYRLVTSWRTCYTVDHNSTVANEKNATQALVLYLQSFAPGLTARLERIVGEPSADIIGKAALVMQLRESLVRAADREEIDAANNARLLRALSGAQVADNGVAAAVMSYLAEKTEKQAQSGAMRVAKIAELGRSLTGFPSDGSSGCFEALREQRVYSLMARFLKEKSAVKSAAALNLDADRLQQLMKVWNRTYEQVFARNLREGRDTTNDTVKPRDLPLEELRLIHPDLTQDDAIALVRSMERVRLKIDQHVRMNNIDPAKKQFITELTEHIATVQLPRPDERMKFLEQLGFSESELESFGFGKEYFIELFRKEQGLAD